MYHRDIKPDNLLVVNDVIKVADLGSVKLVKRGQEVVDSSSLVGTDYFHSPEKRKAVRERVFKIKVNLDKSDVFSLGITFIKYALNLRHKDISQFNEDNGRACINLTLD